MHSIYKIGVPYKSYKPLEMLKCDMIHNQGTMRQSGGRPLVSKGGAGVSFYCSTQTGEDHRYARACESQVLF